MTLGTQLFLRASCTLTNFVFSQHLTAFLLSPSTTVQGMEKGFPTKKKNVPPPQKEVFKELSLELRGRDSPESGSLYSDYESGQQYEDKVGCYQLYNQQTVDTILNFRNREDPGDLLLH